MRGVLTNIERHHIDRRANTRSRRATRCAAYSRRSRLD
ncbi:hypothetical protein NFJ02_09g139970 [Pycnococcus provasolii]